MKRNIYLNVTDEESIETVIDFVLKDINYQIKEEEILVTESLGRITFAEVIAKVSSPFYNASAMDGIAVKHQDTELASESKMILLTDFEYINTGNQVPEKYDAVIMIEDVIEKDHQQYIIKPVNIFEHIRPIGEDIVEGELLILKNHKIRPVDIASMLGGGVEKIKVIRTPKFAIIPTGTEIIDDVNEIEIGKIIDTNSHYIGNSLTELGVNYQKIPCIKDDYQLLKNVLTKATKAVDFIIVGAGSSAGTKDFVKAAIEQLGEVYLHGINVKPGKPVIIGKIDKCMIIGLPGYPVSTFIGFDLVVKRLVLKILKQREIKREQVLAKVNKKIYSSLKYSEFVRVKLGFINDQFIATPLKRGAGITTSLLRADGLLKIDKNTEGIEKGELVKISLLKEIAVIKNTVISIGSHDILMDYISGLMNDKWTLSSIHVGSFGGVLAIKNKECHIAPIHLLDNGVYNQSIIDKYNLDAYLVRGVTRTQGIVLKKGNPKNIKSLKDLKKCLFVNRQRGSGTRVLFDYLLEKEGIGCHEIKGYDYELTTHMLIASEVEKGRADAGLAIKSIANLKGLEFIEVGKEHYDFLISKEVFKTSKVQKFLEVLNSAELKEKLAAIGGYQTTDSGEIIK